MGQAVAALSAAAGEHLAAVSGPHPLPESVDFSALTFFGLIGTEHLHTPPSRWFCREAKGPLYSTAGKDFPPQLTVLSLHIDKQKILYIKKNRMSTKNS